MRAGVTLFAPNGTLDGVTSWADLKDAVVATRLGETAATRVLLPAPQRLGDSFCPSLPPRPPDVCPKSYLHSCAPCMHVPVIRTEPPSSLTPLNILHLISSNLIFARLP